MAQVIRDLAAGSDFWVRQRLDRRLRPGRMRSLAACGQALGPGRVGGLWLLRLAFPLVLGPAALSDLHAAGMAVLRALADPKTGEREVLAAMLDVEPRLATARPGLSLIHRQGIPRWTRREEDHVFKRRRVYGAQVPGER